MAELVHARIDTEALLESSARTDCGAVAVFLGTTRNHHEGRRVTRLAYEAYEPMAVTALEVIETAACEKFSIEACRIVHRLGDVPPAEASVVVVVTAAHRGPAFDACRWAMDELKRSVPIWKRETYAEGDGQWVEGKPLS